MSLANGGLEYPFRSSALYKLVKEVYEVQKQE